MLRKNHQVITLVQCFHALPDRLSQFHRGITVDRNGLQGIHNIHAQPSQKPGKQFAHKYRKKSLLAECILV